MMRIVLLGHFPVDAPPTGGVQSVMVNLRDALAQREGIELHLVQHRRGIPDGTVVRTGWTEHNIAAQEDRIMPNMLRTGKRLAPLLRSLQPDVVSTHQPEYAVVALDMSIPTLHTIHGFPGQEFWVRRGVVTRMAMLLEAWQEWMMLQKVRHLVAISDMVIERYRRRTRAHFHRINNPVSPHFFEPGPDPDPNHLLLVGNLTPVKGIDVAIRAIAQLRNDFPQLQLTIVGREPDSVYAAQMRELAAPLGDVVRFLGPVSQQEIKALLDQSIALLLTSTQEHAPMIVAEAMAAGRAVVATRVGAVTSMVSAGETGYLVDAGDISGIASAVARLLHNPSLAQKFGQIAAEIARQQYHPSAVADAYLHAMRETIDTT